MSNPTVATKFYAYLNHKLQQANIQPIDPANYEPARPEVYTGDGASNTRIIFRPPLVSPIITSTVITYNRGNIANRSDLTCNRAAHTQLSDLLPQINEQLGLTLTLADIVNVPLPGSGNVQLAMHADNLLLFGATEVTLIV